MSPEVLVWSQAISRGIEFLVEISLVAAVLAVFKHHALPLAYIALPFAIVILAALTVAIAFPVAALGVFFHDIQHAVPVALTLLGYISPVFYSLTLVPEALRVWFLLLNPFTRVIPLFHAILYEGRMPALNEWVLAAMLSFSLAAIGMSVFRIRRTVYAEIV